MPAPRKFEALLFITPAETRPTGRELNIVIVKVSNEHTSERVVSEPIAGSRAVVQAPFLIQKGRLIDVTIDLVRSMRGDKVAPW